MKTHPDHDILFTFREIKRKKFAWKIKKKSKLKDFLLILKKINEINFLQKSLHYFIY